MSEKRWEVLLDLDEFIEALGDAGWSVMNDFIAHYVGNTLLGDIQYEVKGVRGDHLVLWVTGDDSEREPGAMPTWQAKELKEGALPDIHAKVDEALQALRVAKELYARAQGVDLTTHALATQIDDAIKAITG